MRIPRCIPLLSLCVLWFSLAPGSALALDAGTARIDLTPPLEMQAALGGYGERLGRPATGVHDRIWAKAVVFRSGDRRLALVTADVLGFPPPVKPAVLAALAKGEWSADEVMLLPSHSHTSLDLSALNPSNDLGNVRIGVFHRELYDRTVQLLSEVIRQAARVPVPVQIGTDSVVLTGWNRNRRGGNGAVDRELTLTRVDSDSGQPLAVLVNWTAHPTFMDEEDMMFSGGWPGHLQRTLEALIGDGVTVLYYNGAEGDQSPVSQTAGGSNWERAEGYGRDLAFQAWKLWQGVQPQPSEVLRARLETIDLPERAWHPDFMRTGGTEYGLDEQSMGVLLDKLAPAKTHALSVVVGDLAVVGIPGELAAELGLQLKASVRSATGIKHVTIGGLADEWVSYILPPAEYVRGGYEASVSFYGPGLAQAILGGAQRASGVQ